MSLWTRRSPCRRLSRYACDAKNRCVDILLICSLIVSLRAQGVTRLLLTSIPYFREVIVMSFRCDHCGFSNNEVQSAGSIRSEQLSVLCVLPCPDCSSA